MTDAERIKHLEQDIRGLTVVVHNHQQHIAELNKDLQALYNIVSRTTPPIERTIHD